MGLSFSPGCADISYVQVICDKSEYGSLKADQILLVYRGFPTRTVYLDYISLYRYTILVGNPRYTKANNHKNVKQFILT